MMDDVSLVEVVKQLESEDSGLSFAPLAARRVEPGAEAKRNPARE